MGKCCVDVIDASESLIILTDMRTSVQASSRVMGIVKSRHSCILYRHGQQLSDLP
jgi:hypothetical protein